jgi:hypothetical protein
MQLKALVVYMSQVLRRIYYDIGPIEFLLCGKQSLTLKGSKRDLPSLPNVS